MGSAIDQDQNLRELEVQYPELSEDRIRLQSCIIFLYLASFMMLIILFVSGFRSYNWIAILIATIFTAILIKCWSFIDRADVNFVNTVIKNKNYKEKISDFEEKFLFQDRKNFELQKNNESSNEILKSYKIQFEEQKDTISYSKNIIDEKDAQILAHRATISSLEASNGLLEKSSKDLDENYRNQIAELEKNKNSLRKSLTKEQDEHIKTQENALSNMDLIYLVDGLRSKIEDGKKVSESDYTKIALLYGALHEQVPDIKRVQDLALVPHEALRAQQIQTVVDHYSKLITDAENDAGISDTERSDKIRMYRMARDNELGVGGLD